MAPTLKQKGVHTQQEIAGHLTELHDALVKGYVGDGDREISLVGSCAMFGGVGDDIDFVVVAETDDDRERLLKAGYTLTTVSSCEEEDEFVTFRKGPVNVMLTGQRDWYLNYLTATEVCKALQLKVKWQRVMVHRIIMNGEPTEMAERKAKERYGDS